MTRSSGWPAPRLERVLLGPMRAALLEASFETGLLHALARTGGRPRRPDELARRARISGAGAALLLAGLQELGWARRGGGGWSLTPLGRTELAAGAGALRGALDLTCALNWRLFPMLRRAARKGGAVVPRQLARGAEARRVAALSTLAGAAVAPAAAGLRQILGAGGLRRWLDVGAGAGRLSFGLLRRFPRAMAVLVDRPHVVRSSRRGAPAVVAERVRWRPGDILERSWGREFDAVLLSQVLSEAPDLDDWFARAAAALRPAGVLLVHDTFAGRRGFPLALQALLMLLGPRPPRRAADVMRALQRNRFQVVRKQRPTRWTQLWLARLRG